MSNGDKIVAEIKKNSRETIRVTVGEFNGYQLAGVRVWFRADDGTSRPGKAGLSFKLELLPDVVGALVLAVEQARADGTLPPAGAA
jgi:hypothetical protein